MFPQLFGWFSLLGVVYAALLFFWNIFNPNQRDTRINIHCSISKITIVTVAAHILSQPLDRFSNEWVIWLGLGTYLIIIASGMVLMYLPEAGKIRYHARSIHSALFVVLAVSILQHVLKF